MSQVKRKRDRGGKRDSPQELAVAKKIKVSHLQDCGEHLPIFVTTPGVSLPTNASFQSYQKPRKSVQPRSQTQTEILLHSSQHSSLDYEAREELCTNGDAFLKHYFGIFDPARNHLQLIPARRLIVRSRIRPKLQEPKEASQDENTQSTALSARNQLGLAFGTKKSQKAIQSLAANAIKASPSKSAKSGDAQAGLELDPASQALISSMAEVASSMPSQKELQAKAAENRPVPKPNVDADNAADVYPVEELVGGMDNLRNMAVKEWIDKIQAGGDVPTRSLFVARRLVKIVESGDVKKVRILKYLLLLIEWYKCLKSVSKTEKKVPKLEDMADLVGKFGSELVNGAGRRFARDGLILNKWYQDNLTTHILALALTIDGFSSDTHNIREDLRIEQRDLTKFHRELGCVLRLPRDKERAELRITKAEGPAHRIAELKLPLALPTPAMRRP